MTPTFRIAARLIEAAKTERRLPNEGTRPAGIKGYWPEARYSRADMNQWGQHAKAARDAGIELDRYIDVEHHDFNPDDEFTWRVEERTRFQDYRDEVRAAMESGLIPSEVSRFEECIVWIIVHVRRPEDRQAVHAWAQSKAGGVPFRKWCRENGVRLFTGQRRVSRAIDQIAAQVGHKMDFRNENCENGVWSKTAAEGNDFGTLEVVRTPPFHRDPDAVPKGHDDTPEALEAVEKAIAAHNERMRRKNRPAGSQIEDARRRKLGLLPEDCEAA